MTRVAIVGSRRRDTKEDRQKVRDLVYSLPDDTVVISGGCEGIDTWAAEFARERGLSVVEHLPDLPSPNSPYYMFVQAYHARNYLVAEDAVDGIFAFRAYDKTGGTENTLKHAKRLKREIEEL